ncbi:hypothetical protein M0R45_010906 [Rubus argutus]|uniref:Uncharacterized protein n=1 Tax=Rubus argutus TaxID=59490 RepID=A0AAW1YAP5_RUBAR
MDAETLVTVTETEVTKTLRCPHCDRVCDFFLKHLIDEHDVKLCNGCDGEIEEKKHFNWGKSGGALKAHWNSRHKTDYNFCKNKKCTLPMTPVGHNHSCIY